MNPTARSDYHNVLSKSVKAYGTVHRSQGERYLPLAAGGQGCLSAWHRMVLMDATELGLSIAGLG